jgi:hypothetical protein
MDKVKKIEFNEVSMREIRDVKEALEIFLEQGYGYKQIVKAYFEAYEISDGRGNTFSVAPYAGKDLNEVYDNLPNNFKQALPLQVVKKQAMLFTELVKESEKQGKPLKEVAKEYFRPRPDSDVRPPFDGDVRPPFDREINTPLEEAQA